VVVLVGVIGSTPEGPLLLAVGLAHAVDEAAGRKAVQELGVVRRPVDLVVVAREVEISADYEGPTFQQRRELLECLVDERADARRGWGVNADSHQGRGALKLDLGGGEPDAVLRAELKRSGCAVPEVDR